MPLSLLPIAQSQVGQDWTKYCYWAGQDGRVEWCAIFVSWCAQQAGYSLVYFGDSGYLAPDPNHFPYYQVVGAGAEWFRDVNRLGYAPAWGGNYIPRPGDVVFFTWHSDPRLGGLDHTGIVESVQGRMVHTIEGNNRGGVGVDLVRRDEWSLDSDEMVCFGMMNGTALTVSDLVIAAMCGNFWRESTVNPGIWESLTPMPWDFVYAYTGVGGFGLGGFTNTFQPSTGQVDWRLRNYHDWCVQNGYSEDDGNAVLYYIVFVERLWAGHYQNDDFDAWLNSTETDLYTLVDQWCTYWEGVPGDHMTERFDYAQRALQYIQDHKNDDPTQYTWIAGNWYSSEPQILNNIMCLYFWFTSYYTPGGGGGGGKKPRNKRLPVWMMLRAPDLY